ncbi:putative RNA methyltransferase [Lacticaseibacillus saniviri]|uniref:SAM-dependent methyltransferase n=1 Tax=Lacticaseibacillus saniviri JCM 17471 = DSM 24301 TaxID=1293598 RepID=A0A0R2MV67_9LACO|nr:methyltransferase domain-containing protein [Lacticaseibacillus saniviri]KRO16780.1 SAM-dependent methyltransferase [Lacticaseibacillus saniviri JCM 17471 = DSM 24301]MCG4281762.1 methyltransferase domain-containing protein [Lacticaseibacillus saniviri]
MRKIFEKAQFVSDHPGIFACPVCGAELLRDELSLVCANQHRFDLAKKGTVNFLNAPVATEYSTNMLSARRTALNAGLFDPFLDEIKPQLNAADRVLDIGCGEGTPTVKLAESGATTIGFDISAPAINLAGALNSPAFFCVADLAHLPFLAGSFTTIVDLFSPGAYAEFERVAPGGRLFKVIPNADYLKQLREGLYAGSDKATYSNAKVMSHLQQRYPEAQIQRVRYDFALTPALFEAVLTMTPLSWQASVEARTQLLANPPAAITVDVSLITVDSLG